MSRAFTPPDTMSKDDIRTVADVRRSIWTNGLTGLGLGSSGALVVHTVASLGMRRGLWKLPLNRNTAMLSTMLGGASGSFIMATTAGKNEVHNLHPIFRLGAKETKKPTDDGFDVIRKEQEMEKNRLIRRATMENSLSAGPRRSQ